MDYDICLDAAAMLFMFIIAASTARQYITPNKQHTCFRRLVTANMTALALDIISTVCMSYSETCPIWIAAAASAGDFIAISLTIMYYVRYIETFINEQDIPINESVDKLINIIFALYCAAHAVNIFTGFIFYFDENRTYLRGSCYIIVYVIPLIFFIYGTALMYRSRRIIDKRLVNATLISVPIVLAGAFLQFTLLSHNLVMLFAVTLAITIMFLNLETPDYEKLKHTMEELELSREEADAANRSKSDFLANMSHEIRTPMNSIVGMCELILREDINDNVRDCCGNIRNSGRSLLSIINDILDFSKIESGKMELIEDKFELTPMLSDIVNMAFTRKGEKNIVIFADVDPNIPSLLIGDEIRVRQIIINLVTNAVKYTNEGYVLIDVSFGRTENGGILMVSVKDTGIGISEENIRKLFSSFQQVDTKKNRAVEGTGLGLAVTKQLVSLMNGEISVSSVYGEGSEFTVRIPLGVADRHSFIKVNDPENVHAAIIADFEKMGPEKVQECYKQLLEKMREPLGIDMKIYQSVGEFRSEYKRGAFTHIVTGTEEYSADNGLFLSAADGAEVIIVRDRADHTSLPKKFRTVYRPFYALPFAALLNGETVTAHTDSDTFITGFTAPEAKVLIVDDNAVNLKVAAGLMRPYQMSITTAESGEAALFYIRSERFDLVFMDHMMPVMDGIEASKLIREMQGEHYKNLPIIALTANAVNDAKEQFLAAGMNDFLAKPIELPALDRILRAWLPKDLIKQGAPESALSYKGAKSDSSLIFDFCSGLSYAGGDAENYAEVLEIFVNGAEEKIKLIDEFYEKSDLDNYIIEVHALKSASRIIGSAPLSELAKELEFAGREMRVEVIISKTSELLDLYRRTAECAAEYLRSSKNGRLPEKGITDPREISEDELRIYVSSILEACSLFDDDDILAVCAEGMYTLLDGAPLKPFFEEIKNLARDFEYDEAAEKTVKFSEEHNIELARV